jgi:hypothetical protein
MRGLSAVSLECDLGDADIGELPAGRDSLDNPFADISEIGIRLVEKLFDFIEAAQFLCPLRQEPD